MVRSHPTPAVRSWPSRRRRRRARRRAVALGVLVIVAVGASLVIARSTKGSSTSSPTTRAPRVTTTSAPLATTTVPPTTTVDPGSLPQTGAFPSATGPAFTARMAALWAGVVTSTTQPALPAFFPESAYVALKAVGNASSDYTGRLLVEYGADLAAAHALLGAVPAAATLVGVNVDSGYGHWVPPGTCYNTVGYYEMPNARVVYSVAGQVESFGIASMISWRGEWYVVHLGAILRSGGGGEVDTPQSGPGTSAYSSTC